MRVLIFVFSAILISTTWANKASAQDSITYLTGRVLTGKVVEVDSMDIKVEVKKRKKTKIIYVAKDMVFALKYADGKTEISYEPYEGDAEAYSIREMELFIMEKY